jgi:hypothetical protein
MAHANNSLITGKLKGSIGKELVFREWAGKIIVAKAPRKRPGPPTPAQTVIRDKFFMASRYGKAILSNTDPALAAAYTAALHPRQNLYTRALADFLSPPEVKKIDTSNYNGLAGSTLLICAVDDFRVVSVWVEIYDASGSLLEAGNAVQQIDGICWTYTVQMDNSFPEGSRIKAIARDVPGNEGMKEGFLLSTPLR